MCARFELINLARFRDIGRFHLTEAELWSTDRPDIRPTQMIPVIISTRELVAMRWGLVPHWASDIHMGSKAINARAEGIEDKPFFRGPLRGSRCLIPATGFIEWRQEGTRKVKYRFGLRDEGLFCFAGLYDIWRDPEGHDIRSCTIITTTPNDLLAEYHNRMPVILESHDEQAWLDLGMREVGRIKTLLKPFPAEGMSVQAA